MKTTIISKTKTAKGNFLLKLSYRELKEFDGYSVEAKKIYYLFVKSTTLEVGDVLVLPSNFSTTEKEFELPDNKGTATLTYVRL